MTKVLLFGAGGQLGTEIRRQAPETISLRACSSAEVDITRPDAVEKIIKDLQPAVIINAAAYTNVDRAEEEADKAFAVNTEGPANIARAVEQQAAHIIHISTDFVFSGAGNEPFRPEDATGPVNTYGNSKLGGERNLLALVPQRTTIIRTAWLYSAHGHNFLNTMLKLMREKDELSVVDDQLGSPTSAKVLADVIWRFVEAGTPAGIYHWTGTGISSWYGFAREIRKQALEIGQLQKSIAIRAITTAEYPTPARRPAFSALDKSAAVKVSGIEGKPWQEELTEVLLTL